MDSLTCQLKESAAMFRTLPDGPGAWRQALFVLLPVVMGAAVLVASDAPSTGMSRLEATQTSVAGLLGEQPLGAAASTIDPPAVPAAGEASSSVAPAPPDTTSDPRAVPGAPSEAGPAGTAAAIPPAVVSAMGGADASVVVAGEAASPASSSSPATNAPSPSSSTTTTTTTTTTTPARSARFPPAEAEVVPLTNADRSAGGLGTLSRNACLDAAASGFAEQMARSGVLAHNPGARAAVNGCRSNATWGDNVGMSSACDTALLEREWMASPGHRRNILTGAFTLLGVGAWTDEKGACWVQVLFSS
jgi:uncharacterized protein YkwD